MRKKIALMIVAAAGAVAVLVPASSSAQEPACIVVDVPPVHLQLGYAPNGPDDCTHLPPPA